MEKAAVFVDAGYLLATGAELITGSPRRSRIDVSYSTLVSTLIDFAGDHSKLPVLRLYWYDGAKDVVPTQEQLTIARLPQVKLRLGRQTPHGQKGVDSLIVLDLVTLARERAMDRAYLLSGDEDIREGAVVAQQMGVSVVLVGVPTRTGHSNQADSLIREADEHLILDRTLVIDPHMRVAATTAPSPVPAPTTASARQLGAEFGAKWLAKATHSEALTLRRQIPSIPRVLDAELFRAAERVLGPLRAVQGLRHEIRAGFWDAVVQSLEGAPSDGDDEDPS